MQVVCKNAPQLAVGMPIASQFNEKVAMDLKQDSSCDRHVVQVHHFCFIDRRISSDAINAVMQHWIGIFGIIGSIMTGNGGEFSSDEMREIMSILNVIVIMIGWVQSLKQIFINVLYQIYL